MIRITRSLFLRKKDYNFFQYAQPCALPKQILFEFFAHNCHTTASAAAQEEENDSVNARILDPKKHTLVENAFCHLNSDKNEDITQETLFENLNAQEKKVRQRDKTLRSKIINSLLLEEDIVNIPVSLSAQQALLLMNHLAATNNRSMKLLKVIFDVMLANEYKFNLKDCSSILYNLAKLSCKNKAVIDKVAVQILEQKTKFTAGVLPVSILHSLGVLRYRNCELIEELLKIVLKNEEQCKLPLNHMLRCLTTLATVNFLSPYRTFLIKELSSKKDTDFAESKAYLNFVWSCILLNEFNLEHVSKVLSESFIEKLFLTKDENSTAAYFKLLTIQGAVTSFVPSYEGPFFNENLFVEWKTTQHVSKQKSQFLTSVVDGLGHIFQKPEFIKTNVHVGGGFLLDVECCLDSKGNPVSLKKKDRNTKIGIILLNFNDICLDDHQTMTGVSALKKRIIESKGYKTLTITYSEYNNSLPLEDKVLFLQKNLKGLVN